MAINVSVQHYGGFLPDIILLTQWYYHRGTLLTGPHTLEPKKNILGTNTDETVTRLLLLLLLFLTFSALVANRKNYFTRWPIPLVVC